MINNKAIKLTKQKIRSKMLLKLKSQKEETQNKKSKTIKERLLRLRIFKKAKTVMFYIAFSGEVKTEEMIRLAKKMGKIVCVPVMKKNGISMRPALMKKDAKLVKGPYGVMQPAIEEIINLKDLDLVVVPGLAFDKKGTRLGRGKGCYDRFLGKIPKHTNTVALAYNFQILPSVPAATRDINVKKVLFA
ncbi:MAG: 5-formyltetrahydrofolate cyclo-ligase [Candidatus Omnitrophota bacterium]|nr:5-formyltetrahydrofolate cyclo-ligase [Candidatus Omnitrophota bacterium]